MRTRPRGTTRAALLLCAAAVPLLTGCGVTAQDQPQPLVTSPVNPAPTPTLTQRPDPTTSSTATPTTTATASST